MEVGAEGVDGHGSIGIEKRAFALIVQTEVEHRVVAPFSHAHRTVVAIESDDTFLHRKICIFDFHVIECRINDVITLIPLHDIGCAGGDALHFSKVERQCATGE